MPRRHFCACVTSARSSTTRSSTTSSSTTTSTARSTSSARSWSPSGPAASRRRRSRSRCCASAGCPGEAEAGTCMSTGGQVLGVIRRAAALHEIEGLRTWTRSARTRRTARRATRSSAAGSERRRSSFCRGIGRGHRALAPHEIPFRANVCALKLLGATHLVSVSAVGSMKEHIAPGDFVVVDQLVDLTKRRVSTFFEGGVVGHVGFADPVCAQLSAALAKAAAQAGARVHEGGTYVCIEGPQFSSRAESLIYRSWGVSVIGMTALPEAKLAREAELPYAASRCPPPTTTAGTRARPPKTWHVSTRSSHAAERPKQQPSRPAHPAGALLRPSRGQPRQGRPCPPPSRPRDRGRRAVLASRTARAPRPGCRLERPAD